MKNRLLQRLEGRTIAIVGNSRVLKDYSAEIDSADVVIRFNHCYNYKSGMVGKRIDIICQTVAQAWFDAVNAGEANLEEIKRQRPEVFLVKRLDNYTTNTHLAYGDRIRINNTTGFFAPWARFTTGTAVLAGLASTLANAKVKCYGFANEGDDSIWKTYMETDAKHYHEVADEDRATQFKSIATLESLTITEPGDGIIHKAIVVPVKATSTGAPGKNRILLRHCLEKLKNLPYKVFVTGDDYELLHGVKDLAEVVPLPAIDVYSDVTNTLRKWQVETGFVGDIAIVQCTSPSLDPSWVEQCFSEAAYAPVVATTVKPDFKPTALYKQENGIFIPYAKDMPPTSVARQLLPETVLVTGAVVVVHTDALAADSLYQAGAMRPVMVPVEQSLDVDTKADLAKAVKILGERPEK